MPVAYVRVRRVDERHGQAQMEEEKRRAARPRYEDPPRHADRVRLDAQRRHDIWPSRRNSHDAGLARKVAAQMRLDEDYASEDSYSDGPSTADSPSPRINLHGPTARKVLPRRGPVPDYRETKTSDGGKDTFRYVKKIGDGGQGHCDLYERQRDGKQLVCKVMKHSVHTLNGKPQEAIILRDILEPHRRIINLKLWDISPSSTQLWYEYCGGGDLQDLVDNYIDHRTPVPESFIWHAYIQMAEAFAYIHTGYDRLSADRHPPKGWQPIVHRDIKPPNVFLRHDKYGGYPDLVLADFGIATTALHGDRLIGTPCYQGPEVPAHSREGDIWSLGACIHVMCTGSPPLTKVPKGVRTDDHYENPDARVVADVTRFGFSGKLKSALYLTLRTRRKDRTWGKDLINR
ncbi:MAG: hypothetical protein Q9179_006084, partial [Wetmoreana sp. 5 TL-2023]